LCTKLYAQNTVQQTYSIDQITKLAFQNSQALKISSISVEISKQKTEVAKLAYTPSVTSSFNALYLGDVTVYNKDFSKLTTVNMPHFGNSFGIQAQQIIFKGGLLKNSVKISSLQEQISELDFQNNKLDIKFLVIANYLDLYKLYNQKKVFEKNIILAKERLKNIQKLYEQEMLTKNEVLRGELQLINLEQSVVSINNNISILNKQLTTVVGLPDNIIIMPEENTVNNTIVNNANDGQFYKNLALENHPTLKIAETNKSIAETNLKITKSSYYPSLAAVGGYNFQRPVSSGMTVLDAYLNPWQVGVGLTYNIDALYSTPKKSKLANLQFEQVAELKQLQIQNIENDVNASFIKHLEAITQEKVYLQSKKLADENYRIIEKKYLNQLAIMADMIDASNAKLDAELQHANAEINILFTYYKLLKSSGTL
jgi:outer membrane protein TolC